MDDGAAEQVALPVVDAELAIALGLGCCLYHLCDRENLVLPAEARDIAKERAIALVVQRIAAEGAVDLHEIDRNTAQVVKGVCAGAQIVQAEPEAALTQSLHHPVDGFDLAEDYSLRE